MPDYRSLRIIVLGMFTTACGATALLYFTQLIEFAEVTPILTMLTGILVLAISAVSLLSQRSTTHAFNTAWWGTVLFLLGAVWFLKVNEVFTVYTFWAVLAFILGILTVLIGAYKLVVREKKRRGRPRKQKIEQTTQRYS